MRRKQWVLYCSNRYGGKEFYISRDYKTPFYSLRTLDHYVDIFETYEAAYKAACSSIDNFCKRMQQQKIYLRGVRS